MKSLFAVLALVVCGCHNSASPNTAANQAEVLPLPDKCEQRPCEDNFSKAGDLVADGSRYAWDEGRQAYRFLTSEEMKVRYQNAWEAAKNASKKVYDAAEQSYQEHNSK